MRRFVFTALFVVLGVLKIPVVECQKKSRAMN